MWERLRSIWTAPDLRNKILFTLGILLLTRVLANITIPLTHSEHQALVNLFSGSNSSGNQNLGQLLGLLDVFSGGSLQKFSIIGLGVYPYITATIVMQLLQPIIPALQNMSMEGEAGRLKFSQITRIITVPLALLYALGNSSLYEQQNVLQNFDLFNPAYALKSWSIIIVLTAGTMILVWLGELITEKGIGNGVSLIIFAGIVSNLPQQVIQGYSTMAAGGGTGGIVSIAGFLIVGLLTIVGIVYVYQGQRRVPVQYPTKRMVGRGMLVGSAQTTYIPIQVNGAGMIPLIFAQSMLLFPSIVSRYLTTSNAPWLKDAATWVTTYLANTNAWYYWAIFFLLVVAFTYFYAYVLWQQQNIPENLQKQGAFIPGYRPGEPTSRYLEIILSRVTLGGALFLGVVAILPWLAHAGQLLSSAALLIAVGVVLDTVRQLEAQMVMRNYSGFLS